MNHFDWHDLVSAGLMLGCIVALAWYLHKSPPKDEGEQKR